MEIKNQEELNISNKINLLIKLKDNIKTEWLLNNPLKILFENENLEPVANYIFFGNSNEEMGRFWSIIGEIVNNMRNENKCDLFILMRIHILNTLINGIDKTIKNQDLYDKNLVEELEIKLVNCKELIDNEKNVMENGNLNDSYKYSEEWSNKYNDCSIFNILLKFKLDISNENKKIYNDLGNNIN